MPADMNKIYNTTAVYDEHLQHFSIYPLQHFGIYPETAMIYGRKPEEILDVTFKISDDQTINEKAIDYWGWYNESDDDFTMIYPAYFLLNMCFTYGIENAEKNGSGKAYKLEIISTTSYKESK